MRTRGELYLGVLIHIAFDLVAFGWAPLLYSPGSIGPDWVTWMGTHEQPGGYGCVAVWSWPLWRVFLEGRRGARQICGYFAYSMTILVFLSGTLTGQLTVSLGLPIPVALGVRTAAFLYLAALAYYIYLSPGGLYHRTNSARRV